MGQGFNNRRYLGKPMGFSEDWEDRNDDVQGIDETDEEYKIRMRKKRNKRLDEEGRP